ncbi:unnamed protein product [Heterosigma akashiwo]
MERVLYVWGLRHPASGYVQGISELICPFILVFISDYLEEGQEPETVDVERLRGGGAGGGGGRLLLVRHQAPRPSAGPLHGRAARHPAHAAAAGRPPPAGGRAAARAPAGAGGARAAVRRAVDEQPAPARAARPGGRAGLGHLLEPGGGVRCLSRPPLRCPSHSFF